nr:HAMP domain-containing sensor histidine kinase [Thalassotalea sp. G2M2-11]
MVFITISIIFFFWMEQLEKQARYESEQNLHLSLAANIARDNPILQQGVSDHQALKELFHNLMVLGPAFEFYFLDPQGNIVTHSISPSLIKRHRINVKPINLLTQNQAPLPIYGDDPQHFTRQKIFSAAPVFSDGQLQGYLYIIVVGERYESAYVRQESNRIGQLSMVMLIGALCFLSIVMLGLFAYFTKPLRQLNKDIKALKKVGFDLTKTNLASWKQNSDNEVHQLGCAFKQMAEQIGSQLALLRNNDQQRKELLADISHDLRTPLASLQGYIETISLNKAQLSTEQQKYIDTALRNSHQLKRLIDQIFELAHLEGGQVSINLENFNLTELLYDVSAKFSLQAKAKNIQLTVEPPSVNMMVHSDIAKLERVLSNLIENALRHTHEGGKITLKMKENAAEQCQLSVIDNGTGINKDELAYIFDARYRASNATLGKEKHTGLGLAITKKLLELLTIDIKVVSELGQGTEFYFNIDKAKYNIDN